MDDINFKKILEEEHEDSKRYLGALSEDFHSRVDAIAEQYGDIKKTLDMHTEILDRHTEILKEHTGVIGSIKVDLGVVKEDVKFIKNSLDKKVDVEEFSALERKVALNLNS